MPKKKRQKNKESSDVSDEIKTGKFTKEESDKLIKAIDEFITENYECSRDLAMKQLIAKRGNLPSILTLIGRDVLPKRPPRSVYNYVRRHMMGHKEGRWSDYEVLVLMKTFFNKHDEETNCWKEVARTLNRSPEQIHDKFREMKPYIQHFKSLIIDPKLTDEEKLSEFELYYKLSRGKIKKNKLEKVTMDSKMQQEFYDYIRDTMSSNRKSDTIENIPWVKIQERFPQYPVSKLRIHFNMTLLPKVYRKVFPGFSVKMVSRLSIRWIRKLIKRPNSESIQSLHDIDFRIKFPQLPVIYIRHCTRRALTKTVHRYTTQLMKPHKFMLDNDMTDVEIAELRNHNHSSLRELFSNKNFDRVIKFAYKDMDVKKWKREDKRILRLIKKDILPECKL